MVALYPDLGSMTFEKDSALNFTFIIDRYGLQCSIELVGYVRTRVCVMPMRP